jgi:hypothetical protein
MKTFFLLLLVSSSSVVCAQTDNRIFFSQLMVVFSDLDKNFEFLKGEMKGREGNMAYYEAGITLEGTRENTIIVSSDTSFIFQAIVNDSTSEEGARLILGAWKTKLISVLEGSSFTQPTALPAGKDAASGYQFASDKISTLLRLHKEAGWYWIDLIIKLK